MEQATSGATGAPLPYSPPGDLPRWASHRHLRPALAALAVALVLTAPLALSAYPMRLVQSVAVVAIAVVCLQRWHRGWAPGWGIVGIAATGWTLALLLGWYSVGVDSDAWHLAARWVFTTCALVALVGFSLLLSAGNHRRNVIQLLDAVVVGTSATVVLGVFLAGSINGDRLASIMSLPLLAPLASLCMASYACAAAIGQPSRKLALWLTAGLAVGLVGDLLQMVELSNGTSRTHNAFTPLLAASALLMFAAVLTPDRSGPDELPVPPWRPPVLTALVVAALVVGITDLLVNEAYRPIPLLAGGLMVVAQTVALLMVMSELRAESRGAARASAELRRSEERLHLAIDAAPVGMGVADAEGNLILANRALGDLLGVDPESIVGRNWQEFLGDSGDTDPPITTSGAGVRRIVRPDGRERVAEITARQYPSPDGRRLWFATAVDVTERLEALRRLEHHATHDELTDLPNRRAFSELLAVHLDGGNEGVLVVCDLDQFKFVNDTLGHSVGDALLIALADRFERLSGAGCKVARIGGDEFCVLVPAGHPEPLEIVAGVFSRPFELGDGEVLHATASVGGTLVRPGTDPERLVAEADAAMYRAKAAGPGRREMYSASTGRSMHEQRRTTVGLHRALGADEFEVWFQPIADIANGTIVGQESLVRWRDPSRGLLAPGDFVDVAEECGLISGIGERVLRRALEAAGEGYWQLIGAHVSVNVSATQITDGHFVSTVARELDRLGFDPDRLWLEITESALLTDVRAAKRACHGLRDLGVHLAIDDFGTGYGSLSYLVEFPVESIKIDRAFVAGLDRPSPAWPGRSGQPSRDLAIISALIGLAARLELSCVAEGVETEAQLRRLRRLGCPLVQGYLLGEPTPVADFPAVAVLDLADPLGAAGTDAATVPAAVPEPRSALQDRPGSVS